MYIYNIFVYISCYRTNVIPLKTARFDIIITFNILRYVSFYSIHNIISILRSYLFNYFSCIPFTQDNISESVGCKLQVNLLLHRVHYAVRDFPISALNNLILFIYYIVRVRLCYLKLWLFWVELICYTSEKCYCRHVHKSSFPHMRHE